MYGHVRGSWMGRRGEGYRPTSPDTRIAATAWIPVTVQRKVTSSSQGIFREVRIEPQLTDKRGRQQGSVLRLIAGLAPHSTVGVPATGESGLVRRLSFNWLGRFIWSCNRSSLAIHCKVANVYMNIPSDLIPAGARG